MSYSCPHCGHVNEGRNDERNRWCWKCERFETDFSFVIYSGPPKHVDTDDELDARIRALFTKREAERPTDPSPPAADPAP